MIRLRRSITIWLYRLRRNRETDHVNRGPALRPESRNQANAADRILRDAPISSQLLTWCLRGDGLRTGEIPWLSLPSASSRPLSRRAGTMSSGTTNCPGLACASSCRVSAAISFSINPRSRRYTIALHGVWRQSLPERGQDPTGPCCPRRQPCRRAAARPQGDYCKGAMRAISQRKVRRLITSIGPHISLCSAKSRHRASETRAVDRDHRANSSMHEKNSLTPAARFVPMAVFPQRRGPKNGSLGHFPHQLLLSLGRL
jgi:hypothetical protein